MPATPREDQIKHGPELAGVDTVGRTYGASLFGRMTTYINRFMAIIPRHPGGKLQYSNLPPGCGQSLWVTAPHFGDCSGGTLEFYRMGRDSSLGVLL